MHRHKKYQWKLISTLKMLSLIYQLVVICPTMHLNLSSFSLSMADLFTDYCLCLYVYWVDSNEYLIIVPCNFQRPFLFTQTLLACSILRTFVLYTFFYMEKHRNLGEKEKKTFHQQHTKIPFLVFHS